MILLSLDWRGNDADADAVAVVLILVATKRLAEKRVARDEVQVVARLLRAVGPNLSG
jgi:hypothetical protein